MIRHHVLRTAQRTLLIGAVSLTVAGAALATPSTAASQNAAARLAVTDPALIKSKDLLSAALGKLERIAGKDDLRKKAIDSIQKAIAAIDAADSAAGKPTATSGSSSAEGLADERFSSALTLLVAAESKLTSAGPAGKAALGHVQEAIKLVKAAAA